MAIRASRSRYEREPRSAHGPLEWRADGLQRGHLLSRLQWERETQATTRGDGSRRGPRSLADEVGNPHRQTEPDPGTREAPDSGLTGDRAIEHYLVEVEFTKGQKAGLLVELEPRFGNGLEELARRFDRSTVGCRVGWDWGSCFPTVCSNRCAMVRSRRMAGGVGRYWLEPY